jgi:predicted alpha/beta superfamily hydrolase
MKMMKKLNLLFFIYLLFGQTLFSQIETKPIHNGEKFILKSHVLNQDREIFVGLPQGYDTTSINYPIHFVLDGEMTFSCYYEIVKIKSDINPIHKAIVVGIPNIERNFDFNPKANASNFLKFMTQELIPTINENYRTNEVRTIIGYSLAGNFVFYTLLNGFEYFNNFISGSPYSLDIYTEQDIRKLSSIKELKTIYTSFGENDNGKQLNVFNQFCKKIESVEILELKFEVISNRDHNNNFLINWQDGITFVNKK